MIYYESRMLSHKLNVPLAKWKRWSREFLPSDPLGGLQSGVARQFSLKEAFRVYLGGCLVGTLKFSIPETRQILLDLNGWLKERNYYSLNPKSSLDQPGHEYIYIFERNQGRFGYAVRRGKNAEKEQESPMIRLWSGADVEETFLTARVLNIGRLYSTYLNHLNGALV